MAVFWNSPFLSVTAALPMAFAVLLNKVFVLLLNNVFVLLLNKVFVLLLNKVFVLLLNNVFVLLGRRRLLGVAGRKNRAELWFYHLPHSPSFIRQGLRSTNGFCSKKS